MSTQQDITKTGPVPLQGIRNQDLYNGKSASLNLTKEEQDQLDNLYNQVQYQDYKSKSGNVGYEVLEDQSFYSPQLRPDLDYGSSMFDEGILLDPTQEDINDARANNQPWIAQAAAGVVKGLILAGTTFINGTVGLVYGAGQAIYNAASDDPNKHWYNGLWNNAVTQAMYDLEQASEEALPNYRTTDEINRPWYQNLGTVNFWFDNVVKNIGFTVGAIYSGGIYTKAIGSIFSWFGKAGKAKKIIDTANSAEKAIQASNTTRNTKAIIGSFAAAHAEAVVEAQHSYHDFLNIKSREVELQSQKDIQDAYIQFVNDGGKLLPDGTPDYDNSDRQLSLKLRSRLQQIEDAKRMALDQAKLSGEDVGFMTGLSNLPILWLDNVLMFGRMYAGGFKSSRIAHRGKVKATEQAIKDAKQAAKNGDPTKLVELEQLVKKAEQTGFQGLTEAEKNLIEIGRKHFLGNKMGTAWALSKGPLREGVWEEMMQGAVSQAAQYRYSGAVDRVYDAMLDRQSEATVKGLWESYMHGILSQYGDINKWEEAFIGAITGLVGVPTFGRKTNATATFGKGKRIGITGGSWGEYQEFKAAREREEKLYSQATAVMRSGNLESNLKHLVAQTHFNQKMDQAIIHDDEKEYKDARTAAIFEQVNHLIRVDRLDLLQSAMKAVGEFTNEDIEEIRKQTSSQYAVNNELLQAKKQSKEKIEQQIDSLLKEKQDLENSKLQIEADSTSTSVYSQDDVDQQIQEADNSIAEIDNELKELNDQLGILDSQIKELNPVSISPFMHPDGTEFTTEEIKEDINKRIQHFDKIIKAIKEARYNLDYATSEILTDEQLDTLTWYDVMMKDWSDRSNQIVTSFREVLTDLVNDPAFKEAISAAEEIEELLSEAGEEAKVQFGGRIDLVEKLKNKKKLYDVLIEHLTNGKGIGISLLLASKEAVKDDKGEEVKTKDGKPLTTGELLKQHLLTALESYKDLSESSKSQLEKAIIDLQRIGESYNRHNSLLQEFLSSPEKIDKAHEQSKAKAEKQKDKEEVAAFSDEINWEGTVGSIAKYFLDHMDLIQDEKKFSAFLSDLNEEQQKKAKKARAFALGVEELNDRISKRSSLTDNQKVTLRRIIDDKIGECNSLKELKDKIREALTVEELKNIIPVDESEELSDEYIKKLSATEESIDAFISDEYLEVLSVADEAEKALERAQAEADAISKAEEVNETYIEQAASSDPDSDKALEEKKDEYQREADEITKAEEERLKKEQEEIVEPQEQEEDIVEPNDEEQPEEPIEPEEEPSEETKDDEDNIGKEPIVIGKEVEVNTETQESVKKKNEASRKAGRPEKGEGGHQRRPAISQFFLHGLDKESLYEHYKKHPEDLPKFQFPKDYTEEQKQEYIQRYLNYLKAVTEFISEKGGYAYISGINTSYALKQGDTITFQQDDSLSKTAGTPVVVIYAIRGKDRIPIGTLPTEFEFNIVERSTGKLYKNSYPGLYALYKAALEKQGESLNEQIDNVKKLKEQQPEKKLVSSVKDVEIGDTIIVEHLDNLSKNTEGEVTYISDDRSILTYGIGYGLSDKELEAYKTINRKVYVIKGRTTGTPVILTQETRKSQGKSVQVQITGQATTYSKTGIVKVSIKTVYPDGRQLDGGMQIPIDTADFSVLPRVSQDQTTYQYEEVQYRELSDKEVTERLEEVKFSNRVNPQFLEITDLFYTKDGKIIARTAKAGYVVLKQDPLKTEQTQQEEKEELSKQVQQQNQQKLANDFIQREKYSLELMVFLLQKAHIEKNIGLFDTAVYDNTYGENPDRWFDLALSNITKFKNSPSSTQLLENAISQLLTARKLLLTSGAEPGTSSWSKYENILKEIRSLGIDINSYSTKTVVTIEVAANVSREFTVQCSQKGLSIDNNGKISIDTLYQVVVKPDSSKKAPEVVRGEAKEGTQKTPIETTSTIESLMGGNPAFSAQNRPVSEVFNDQEGTIPLMVVSSTGNRYTDTVDTSKALPITDPIGGQIYVFVTSNRGTQIPLLCYSKPLRELSDDDWYIENTIKVIQKLADKNKVGETKSELIRWLSFFAENNLHIDYKENSDGSTSVLFGWGNVDGKGTFAHSYSIKLQEDGTISEKSALRFIKKLARTKIISGTGQELFPTTNVDRNRLSDTDYVSKIVKYLYTNVMEGNSHTINDWFTFTETQIEKDNTPVKNRVAEEAAKKPVSTQNKPNKRQTTTETSSGTVTIDSSGRVENEDGSEVTSEQIEELTNQIATPEQPTQQQDSEQSQSIAKAFMARASTQRKSTSSTSSLARKRGGNRKRTKPLLKQDTQDKPLSESQVLQDIKRVEKLFPKLASQGRIVIVRGMISIVNEKGNPQEAYGAFKNGVLYISSQAPLGTALHEAFHYISDTLLTQSEKEFMFNEAQKLYGNLPILQLEEKLAESFRNFMNDIQDNTAKGRLRFIWRRLKNIVKSLFGREQYLDNLFWSIYRQRFNNRKESISEDTWKEELLLYRSQKLQYENLSQEQKEYFNQRGLSEENYEKLSLDQKEILLQCM